MIKASEAVEILQRYIKMYGDLPLYSFCAKEGNFYRLSPRSLSVRSKFTSMYDGEQKYPDCIIIM